MQVWKKVFGPVVFLPVLVFGGLAMFGETRVDPKAWEPAPAPSMSAGVYQANHHLSSAVRVGVQTLQQAESLAVGPDDKVYAGLANGDIVRFSPKEPHSEHGEEMPLVEWVANTGGRPLGLAFHPDGLLMVADAELGLLSVEVTGESFANQNPVMSLSVDSEGTPFKLTDDVTVSADGRYVYFTDASSVFALDDALLDILEHQGHGRVLEYDFQTGKTRTVLSGLQFANGLALSPQGDYLLIAETGMYRVLRYWLRGPKAGTHEVFVDNLPGFPDNIRIDSSGHFWLALPSLRDGLVDFLAPYPTFRKAVGRLMEVIDFPVKPYTWVLAFDQHGQVLASLQGGDLQGFYYATQVTPVGKTLYLSSVKTHGLAKVPNPLMKSSGNLNGEYSHEKN